VAYCELVDYSDRTGSLITLYEYPAITLADIAELKDVIPDQMDQVEEGDELAVYIVDNRTDGVKGLLTVWKGKGMACIEMGDGSAWGDWSEEHALVMTEEFEEAEDDKGVTVMGRIAYNTHGIRGVYAQEKFFTLFETD
jgi:hypothetical protein